LYAGGTRYMLIGVSKMFPKDIIIQIRISIADQSKNVKLRDPVHKGLIFFILNIRFRREHTK